MKTSLFTLLFSCIWSLPIYSQNLVGYYPFSGNAGDSSGYGHHGSITGSPNLTTDRNGISGKAYYFNGSSDYITASSTTALQPTSALTLTTWISPDYRTDGGFMNVVCKRHSIATDPWDSYAIATNNSSPYGNKWYSTLSKGSSGSLQIASAKRSYSPQTWLFLAATYDGSNMRFYVNGELDTVVSFAGNIGYSGMPLYIAYNSAGIHEYYKGKIDEVSIYNNALSENEIVDYYKKTNVISLQKDTLEFFSGADNSILNFTCITAWKIVNSASWLSFNQVAGEKNGSVGFFIQANTTGLTRTTDVIIKAGAQYKSLHIRQLGTSGPDLVGWYPFSGNAGDSSGYNNHGTIFGSPGLTTDRNGTAGKAYYFNGTSDYITASPTPSLQPASALTLTTWISPDYRADGGFMNVVCKRYAIATDPWDSYAIATNNNSPYGNKWYSTLSKGSSGSLQIASSKRSYAPQTWLFLAATYDGSNMRFYVNGELDTVVSFTGNIGYSGMPLYIAYNSAGIHEYYKGKIDEVAIYKKALSENEIVDYYKKTKVIFLDSDTLLLSSDSGETFFNLGCITAWEISNLPAWFTFNQLSGEKSMVAGLVQQANTTGNARIADFTIKAGAQTKSVHVIQFPATGINDPGRAKELITLYPNPTWGNFTLTTIGTIQNLLLFDLAGNKVNFEIKNAVPGKMEIDLGDLSKGIYLLEVSFDNGIAHHKILKN